MGGGGAGGGGGAWGWRSSMWWEPYLVGAHGHVPSLPCPKFDPAYCGHNRSPFATCARGRFCSGIRKDGMRNSWFAAFTLAAALLFASAGKDEKMSSSSCPIDCARKFAKEGKK